MPESPSKDKCIVRALYLWANVFFQCMFVEIRLDRICASPLHHNLMRRGKSVRFCEDAHHLCAQEADLSNVKG